MAKYVPYLESLDENTVNFQVACITRLLRFFDEYGIRSVRDLKRVNGRKLLSEPLWKISEANTLADRKHNVRFFSEGAHKLATSTGVIPTSSKTDGVEHEHVIPREHLERLLFACSTQPAEVGRIARFSIGCIVTLVEHRSLGKKAWGNDDPTADPWRRYRDARGGSVRVWDRKRADWVDLRGGIPE